VRPNPPPNDELDVDWAVLGLLSRRCGGLAVARAEATATVVVAVEAGWLGGVVRDDSLGLERFPGEHPIPQLGGSESSSSSSLSLSSSSGKGYLPGRACGLEIEADSACVREAPSNTTFLDDVLDCFGPG
jgi:hypothetical protein